MVSAWLTLRSSFLLLLCLAVQPSDVDTEGIPISETVPADVASVVSNTNGCKLSLELTTEYVLTGLSLDGENLLLDASYVNVYYISTTPVADGVRTSLKMANVSFYSCNLILSLSVAMVSRSSRL